MSAGLHGASVAITGRRQEVLDASKAALQRDGIAVHALQGDVRSYEACERWVATLQAQHDGVIDILVNCAAGNFLATSEELTPNGFKTGAGMYAPSSCTSKHAPSIDRHTLAGFTCYPSAAQQHVTQACATCFYFAHRACHLTVRLHRPGP